MTQFQPFLSPQKHPHAIVVAQKITEAPFEAIFFTIVKIE